MGESAEDGYQHVSVASSTGHRSFSRFFRLTILFVFVFRTQTGKGLDPVTTGSFEPNEGLIVFNTQCACECDVLHGSAVIEKKSFPEKFVFFIFF